MLTEPITGPMLPVSSMAVATIGRMSINRLIARGSAVMRGSLMMSLTNLMEAALALSYAGACSGLVDSSLLMPARQKPWSP